MGSLDRLFQPKSFAILGASNDENKVGFHLLYALRKFPGALYPINPKAKTVQGLKAFRSLKAVGHPVDVVALCIPARACLDAVKEAGETGAGVVFVAGGGYGEAGTEGKAMEEELLSACRRYGVRLLGPNTSGFVNPGWGVTANFNPLVSHFRPGSIAVVSQSGAVSVVLGTVVQSNHLGVSVVVGLGNSVDITVPEVIHYLAGHEQTKAVAVYLEGVTDGRALVEAIRETTKKKPVIVFTVGRADIGEFAVSHTGKMMGSFALKKAALTQAGAVVVSSSNDLIDAAHVLSKYRLPPSPDPGVGILTGQAGPAMIMTDYLRSRSVRIPKLEGSTIERISSLLPIKTYIQNPVDTARPLHQMFSECFSVMAEDPNIDVLLTYAMHEPMCVEPVPLYRTMKGKCEKPMVFATSGLPEDLAPILRDLESMDLPAFVSPDRAAAATWALVEDAKSAFRKGREAGSGDEFPEVAPLIESPDEAGAKTILNVLNIRTPKGLVCRNHAMVMSGFEEMRKPCVLKVLAKGVAHKSDVGGVHLNIETREQLSAAIRKIDRIPVEGQIAYLLEEMAPSGLEVIVGAKRDGSFGPTVMVGLGGTTAEAFGDVSIRLAPLGRADGLDMISELKTSGLFDGWRGGPHYDKKALADLLVRVGGFMTRHPEIVEMDLNPVRIFEKGSMVLDALMVVNAGR